MTPAPLVARWVIQPFSNRRIKISGRAIFDQVRAVDEHDGRPGAAGRWAMCRAHWRMRARLGGEQGGGVRIRRHQNILQPRLAGALGQRENLSVSSNQSAASSLFRTQFPPAKPRREAAENCLSARQTVNDQIFGELGKNLLDRKLVFRQTSLSGNQKNKRQQNKCNCP